MRVISGSARGKNLITPDGLDTRPTAARVKESILNIIQFDIEGSNILDLFAGSGQVGIECLSRGAAHATFVDMGNTPIKCIHQNLDNTGLGLKATVIKKDYDSFLKTYSISSDKEKFNIVFIDPPYKKKIIDDVFTMLERILAEDAIVICEAQITEVIPSHYGTLNLIKEYKYGNTKLLKYTNV